MGKKILKVASLGLIGGKKKKAAPAEQSGPIVTPLEDLTASPLDPRRRRTRGQGLGGTVLGDLSSTLGG